jgi:dsRNA-specific ribonuclease
MHISYLHEHSASLPGITTGLLDALSVLGQAFVRRLAAVDVYSRATSPVVSALSIGVAEVASALAEWASGEPWVLECAAMGRTFAGARPPGKVLEQILRRVVGVLCLAGEEEVAACLLRGLLSDVDRVRSTTITDPKTTLQEAIAPAAVQYTYEREGPDHETVFRATVTARGLCGTGAGRNKKDAAQKAALDLLQKLIPHARSSRTSMLGTRPSPVAIPEPREHVVAVHKLKSLFQLPETAAPLLSQALIHASWAYENRPRIIRYHQQDNQILAFVGAEAALYESALAATYRVVADPPQEFAFRGLDTGCPAK